MKKRKRKYLFKQSERRIIMRTQKVIAFVLLCLLVCMLFPGCAKKGAGNEITVFVHMLPNQQKYFRNVILNDFEKEHNCKVNLVLYDKMWYVETALQLQKEKANPNLSLIKVPFEMTRVLVGKGLMEPLDNIVSKDIMEKDLAEYHPLALGLGYVDNKPYYVPRKLETRVLFYLKPKVDEAIKNWKKFEKDLNKLLKPQNGYGLPKGYTLEEDPEQWDFYDIFVMGYYWAHNKYFNTNVFMPRVAHRGDRYQGTALGLVDRSIQFGATTDDVLKMNTEPVVDMYNWEAVFIKNNIFNSGMWNDPWRGANIHEAIKDGKVFLTIFQQIDCFLVHGWEENPEMQGYLKDPDDMGVATMPVAVSFELNKDGTYKRVGSKKITTGGWWWGIPKTAPAKELAYKLARFITNHKNQAEECSKFGMIPVRKDIINNISETFDLGWVGDIFRVSIQQVDVNGFTTVPLLKEYSEIQKNYVEAWYEMCVDKFSKSPNQPVNRTSIQKGLNDKYAAMQKQILKDKYPAK
jgi:ABC-type glycerol-3-phosphate transport system substrate-binding protein